MKFSLDPLLQMVDLYIVDMDMVDMDMVDMNMVNMNMVDMVDMGMMDMDMVDMDTFWTIFVYFDLIFQLGASDHHIVNFFRGPFLCCLNPLPLQWCCGAVLTR